MEAKFSIVQDHTDTFADSARLTVIGVGGGGGNAVETMVQNGVKALPSSVPIPIDKRLTACQRPIKSSSVSKITTAAWGQVPIQKWVVKQLRAMKNKFANC